MSQWESLENPSEASPLLTMLQMINGYHVSQMIYVAAKLGIADLLKVGPQGVDELAEATGTHAPSLYRLLRALSSLGVFAEDEHGRFELTPLAEPLQKEFPGSLRPWALLAGDPSFWRMWGDLLYTVQTGKSAFNHVFGMGVWEYRAQHPEVNAIFNDAMTNTSMYQTAAIIAAYDFSEIGTLVDVGGGHGTLIAAILKENPAMRGVLFDLPHVVAGAKDLLNAAGVADRCEIVGGDAFKSVPSGGDAYILKFITHGWDDERAIKILRNCHRAMAEGGKLLLVELVIPPGNSPHHGKFGDFHMLVGSEGRERTEAEFGALLEKAGFTLTRIVPTQIDLSVIEGIRAYM